MAADCTREAFIADFSKQVGKARAALFIGSGLSRQAEYKGWKDILREPAVAIGLDVDREDDLISLAEYYVNDKKERSFIDDKIYEIFSPKKSPTDNHLLLASLGITSVWTTNYDQLLERTFEAKNLAYSPLTDDASFSRYVEKNSIVLHKLHGDVDTPEKTVITKEDFERFVQKHEMLLAKLKGEMCSKSFLFLGYSFSDIDINHILTQIRLFYDSRPPARHYCIHKRVSASDPDYTYKSRKQEHQIESMKSYGIQTVLVDSFDEIEDILEDLRKKVCSKNVFISGAYEDFDAEDEYGIYARSIAKWLVEQEYKIYTGYGKNLGAEIVAGAFDGCTKSGKETKRFNEWVYLSPFPYKKSMPDDERRTLYTQLRKNVIQNTMITIIINGTKRNSKRATLNISPGAMEEAQLSLDQGNLLIPLAVTGGAAAEIWENLNASGVALSLKPEFQTLKTGATTGEVFDSVKGLITDFITRGGVV